MKRIIIKTGAAVALGFLTSIGAASAMTAGSDMNSGDSTAQPSTVQKIEHGSVHVAKTAYHDTGRVAKTTVHDTKGFAATTWDESKMVGRTIVYSPVIAYEVIRGERPLFTHARTGDGREQMALSGHRRETSETVHNEPPI